MVQYDFGYRWCCPDAKFIEAVRSNVRRNSAGVSWEAPSISSDGSPSIIATRAQSAYGAPHGLMPIAACITASTIS